MGVPVGQGDVYAAPGWAHMHAREPAVVFLFDVSSGLPRAHYATQQIVDYKGCASIEKRWLLTSAGAQLPEPNAAAAAAAADRRVPYSRCVPGAADDCAALVELIGKGRVAMLQSSPVGSGDAAVKKKIKAWLTRKGVHGRGAYAVPFRREVDARLHASRRTLFVVVSGVQHWRLMPWFQRAQREGRVIGDPPMRRMRGMKGECFSTRWYGEQAVERVLQALRA